MNRREASRRPGAAVSAYDVERTERGFEFLHAACGWRVQQSSAVGDHESPTDRPGSWFLWVGDEHLTPRRVLALASRTPDKVLAAHLHAWLSTGSLKLRRPVR